MDMLLALLQLVATLIPRTCDAPSQYLIPRQAKEGPTRGINRPNPVKEAKTNEFREKANTSQTPAREAKTNEFREKANTSQTPASKPKTNEFCEENKENRRQRKAEDKGKPRTKES
jgi:hypothetical protein